MVYSLCPNCHSDVRLLNPAVGKHIVCPCCATGLKVVKIAPVEVDFDNDEDELMNEIDDSTFDDNWNQ
mgnify:CR=1 FL=1